MEVVGVVAATTLLDWRCIGRYRGNLCDRVLLAYDPALVSVEELRAHLQVKCFKCNTINGIGRFETVRAGARRG